MNGTCEQLHDGKCISVRILTVLQFSSNFAVPVSEILHNTLTTMVMLFISVTSELAVVEVTV